jgi:hypothetical protein
MRMLLFLTLALIGSHALHGQEREKDDLTKEERQARLDFMKAKAAEFELAAEKDQKHAFKLHDEPLLRYTNPVRSSVSDGVTFLWLDGARPVGAATWSIRGTGNVFREFASLTDRPLECRRNGKVVWSPQQGGLLHQPLASSAEPAETASRRLTQMRSLARGFVVETMRPESTVELRLLSQPIYRYEDKESGILDGAVFSLSEATDPEMLLVLEAHRPDGKKNHAWRYTLAKMTSPPVRVRLDGKEIWSVPGYWANPRSPNDPYVEAADGTYTSMAPAKKNE